MSILSGFFKTKKYRKTDSGYKLQSEWTSSQTVECDDNKTIENKVGAIKGITTSLVATEEGYAADATTVASLNSNLDLYIRWSRLHFPSSDISINAGGTQTLTIDVKTSSEELTKYYEPVGVIGIYFTNSYFTVFRNYIDYDGDGKYHISIKNNFTSNITFAKDSAHAILLWRRITK